MYCASGWFFSCVVCLTARRLINLQANQNDFADTVVRDDLKLLHVRNTDEISLCVNLTDKKVLWLPVVVRIANNFLEMPQVTHALAGHRQPTEDTMCKQLRKRIRGPPLQFDRLDLVIQDDPPWEFA